MLGFWQYGAWARLSKCIAVIWLLAGAVQAQTVTIVALGDSLTAGFGLPAAQGFVPQLTRWIEENGPDVRIINAGVSGDTSAGGASRVAWALSEGADAMIVELGGNDMLRGLDPDGTRANLDRILAEGAAQGVELMLVGLIAPPNFGPDFKARFDGMFPDLAKKHDAILEPDFFSALRPLPPQEFGRHMQRDGIHPNAEGVRLIVEALGPSVLKLIERTQ